MRDGAEILQLLLAGLLPCAAYLSLGLRVSSRLGTEAVGVERLALAWIFGTGAASLGIFVLRLVDVPVGLLAAGVLLGISLPLRWLRTRAAPPSRDALPNGPVWVRGVDTASCALGLLVFLAALGPETFWDGFEYHLPLAAAWAEAPIRAIPGMLDAEFRAGIDLLYIPAVTSGFPDAAAAVSAGFAICIAVLVRAEATRRSSAGAGALAGLFTLLAPLTLSLAPSTYVDLGVGAYGFAALLFADRWNRGAPASSLVISSVCLGFALNAKLHALALCPALLAIVWLGGRPAPLLQVARCCGIAALLALPWFAKVALTTGNPFFPFLTSWLGTGPTDPTNLELRQLRLLANYPVERGPMGLARYLGSVSFGRNPHVGGLLGPLPLALAPLALRRLSRATWALVGVVAIAVPLMFFSMPALRFGTPLWPWLAVAAAVGGARLASSGPLARNLLGALLGILLVQQSSAAATQLVGRLAGLRDPQGYEMRSFPDQDALRRMVALAEPVVGIPMGAVSWMPQPVYNLLWERNGELYFGRGMPPGLVRTPPDAAFDLLQRRGVRTLVLDVEQPHPGDGRVGNPAVDAWLADGRANIAADVPPLPARSGRVWVLVRLKEPRPASDPSP